MVIVNKVTFYLKFQKKFWISLPEFIWVIDEGMQSLKKIYSEVMKLNQFFALHFFANDLYSISYNPYFQTNIHEWITSKVQIIQL